MAFPKITKTQVEVSFIFTLDSGHIETAEINSLEKCLTLIQSLKNGHVDQRALPPSVSVNEQGQLAGGRYSIQTCRYCGREQFGTHALALHERACVQRPYDGRKEIYACEPCNRTFVGGAAFSKHNKRFHAALPA